VRDRQLCGFSARNVCRVRQGVQEGQPGEASSDQAHRHDGRGDDDPPTPIPREQTLSSKFGSIGDETMIFDPGLGAHLTPLLAGGLLGNEARVFPLLPHHDIARGQAF
jgi:hypothetical protein